MRAAYNTANPGDWLEDLYFEQTIEERAAFRCDRCGGKFPLSIAIDQDGLQLCRVRCADTWTESDLQRDKQRAAARASSREITPLGRAAHTSPMQDSALVAVTGISPRPLDLTAGEASGDLALEGVGLSSSVTVSVPAVSGLTASATYAADGLSGTITVSPAAGVAGDWDITIEGATFRKIIRVR